MLFRSVTSPSRDLRAGERVRLDGRGDLLVEGVEATKRDRYRIRLLRS